mmetsp:Transcript_99467/g.320723  ORF Transcript_99467/g.320723 Transcript_99467/m.320723 type:complete len:229 (+) Transcript_99467:226-912(+)
MRRASGEPAPSLNAPAKEEWESWRGPSRESVSVVLGSPELASATLASATLARLTGTDRLLASMLSTCLVVMRGEPTIWALTAAATSWNMVSWDSCPSRPPSSESSLLGEHSSGGHCVSLSRSRRMVRYVALQSGSGSCQKAPRSGGFCSTISSQPAGSASSAFKASSLACSQLSSRLSSAPSLSRSSSLQPDRISSSRLLLSLCTSSAGPSSGSRVEAAASEAVRRLW